MSLMLFMTKLINGENMFSKLSVDCLFISNLCKAYENNLSLRDCRQKLLEYCNDLIFVCLLCWVHIVNQFEIFLSNVVLNAFVNMKYSGQQMSAK